MGLLHLLDRLQLGRVQPFRWILRKRAAYNIRKGVAFGMLAIQECGIEIAHATWEASRVRRTSTDFINTDWFDKGVELTIVRAYCMETGEEATLTLHGGAKDGAVVGKINSYGEWEFFEP